MINTIVRLDDLSDESSSKILKNIYLPERHDCAFSDDFLKWIKETNINLSVLEMSPKGFGIPYNPILLSSYTVIFHFRMLYLEFETEAEYLLFKLTW